MENKTSKTSLGEYGKIALEIEEIRRGKHIPLRVFDEHGVSSRTYQRFLKGNADIRLTDFAIIIELLALSPFEATARLCSLSKTMTYKLNYFQALQEMNYEKCLDITKEFTNYFKTTPHTFGKEEALYKVLSADFLSNPRTEVTSEEIIKLEKNIYQRIVNASVYTIYDLDFLAFQQLNNFQHGTLTLFFKVLQLVCSRPLVDIDSKRIIERAFFSLLVSSLRENDSYNVLKTIKSLLARFFSVEQDWRVGMLVKITEHMIKNIDDVKNKKKNWKRFKENIIQALSVFLPKKTVIFLVSQIKILEDTYLNAAC